MLHSIPVRPVAEVSPLLGEGSATARSSGITLWNRIRLEDEEAGEGEMNERKRRETEG